MNTDRTQRSEKSATFSSPTWLLVPPGALMQCPRSGLPACLVLPPGARPALGHRGCPAPWRPAPATPARPRQAAGRGRDRPPCALAGARPPDPVVCRGGDTGWPVARALEGSRGCAPENAKSALEFLAALYAPGACESLLTGHHHSGTIPPYRIRCHNHG